MRDHPRPRGKSMSRGRSNSNALTNQKEGIAMRVIGFLLLLYGLLLSLTRLDLFTWMRDFLAFWIW